MSPRAVELLCDRALWGLDPDEEHELSLLLGTTGAESDDSFDRAAAALDLTKSAMASEPLPAALARRVEGDAIAFLSQMKAAPAGELLALAGGALAAPVTPRAVAPVVPLRRAPVLPWLMAAACVALAAASWLWAAARPESVRLQVMGPAPVVTLPDPTIADQRRALVESGKATVIAWTATDDAAAKGASGDVVWDNENKRGFMRFRGMAKNDPRASQYQLWIFDKSQDERFPIDGGVFDVDPATGEVIVPIVAKLTVVAPTLFAVTVEKPGGVVVSKRERIVVLAKVEG